MKLRLDEDTATEGPYYVQGPIAHGRTVIIARVPSGITYDGMIDMRKGSADFRDQSGIPWHVDAPPGRYRMWFAGRQIVPMEWL